MNSQLEGLMGKATVIITAKALREIIDNKDWESAEQLCEALEALSAKILKPKILN